MPPATQTTAANLVFLIDVNECCDGFHEHAAEQQKQIDYEYHHEHVIGDRQNGVGDGLINALGYQYPAKYILYSGQECKG